MSAVQWAEPPDFRLEVTPEGSLARLRRNGLGSRQGGGRRGAIGDFTKASAKRFKEILSRLDRSACCIMVTLTVPACEAPGPAEAHAILKRFRRRFEYAFPQAGWAWKREHTRRGVVHYHLLTWGIERRQLRAWADRAWSESLNIANPEVRARGLKAGVSVSREVDLGGRAYLAKYACKQTTAPDGQSWGRYWGLTNRETMPVAPAVEVPLTRRAWFATLRVMKKARLLEVNRARAYHGRHPLKRLRASPQGWTCYFANPETWLRVAVNASFA